MKLYQVLLIIVIGLISASAGAAKVLTVPQEVVFFKNLGIGTPYLVAFGVAQIGAGAILLSRTTRHFGLFVAAAMFLLSSLLLLLSGNLRFAVISVAPAALAAYLGFVSKSSVGKKNGG